MAKLLIVDDDKDTCDYLKEFFEQRKCIVATENSGQDALMTIKKDRPDIVLLDFKMRGLDGLETLREIKNFDPTIKVIMMTVASDQETRQKATELGADDFIRKPFNTAYLEGAVSLKVSTFAHERKSEYGNSKDFDR